VLILDVILYGPRDVDPGSSVKPLFDWGPLKGWSDQKERVKSGRRMGMFTVIMPTMVSRTPQRLMLSAEGFAERVKTTRMIAAAITNNPDDRRTPITIFLQSEVSLK